MNYTALFKSEMNQLHHGSTNKKVKKKKINYAQVTKPLRSIYV